MAECRCTDKENCRAKIKKLELASEELDHLITPYLDISEKLNDVANAVPFAFYTSNHLQLASRIRTLKDDMSDAMDSCNAAIIEGIKELQKDLADMEKEDDEYHAEQAKSDTSNTSTTQPGT